jgi:inosose dehydratase
MVKLALHPALWRPKNQEEMQKALSEIDEVGWDGIEWYAHTMEQAQQLKENISGTKLAVAGLYAPADLLNPEALPQEMDFFKRVVDHCIIVGNAHLMLDGGTWKLAGNTEEDVRIIADCCNEIGEYAKNKGIQATWHQHHGSIFEDEELFYLFMELTDPELLHLTAETGQMANSWFDLPKVFKIFAHRMSYVHFKEVDRNRRFIELGRGTVDFPTLWGIMKEAGFDGWIVVDLDYTSLPPKESAEIQLRYFNETLGIPAARSQA